MIWNAFLAALLFEIASIPIICGVGMWVIGIWWDYKVKFIGKVTKAAGEELKKIGKEMANGIKEEEDESND